MGSQVKGQNAKAKRQSRRPEQVSDDGERKTVTWRSQVKGQKAEAKRQRARGMEGGGKQILAGTDDVWPSLSSRFDGMSWSKPTKAGRGKELRK
jgi:hypothetical protein